MYNNTCVETRQTNKCLIGVWLSLARAPDLGSGGRRFESCHPDLISSLRQAQIKRVQFNGRTLAFQARYVGSIPITRSLFCKYISCMQDIMCPQLSWIEQRPSKPWVEGSNPPGHTFFYESWPVAYDFCIMVGIAQLVSASDCGSEGPGFESLYPPFFYFLGYRQAVRHRVLIPALRWFESSQPSSVDRIRSWMIEIDSSLYLVYIVGSQLSWQSTRLLIQVSRVRTPVGSLRWEWLKNHSLFSFRAQ